MAYALSPRIANIGFVIVEEFCAVRARERTNLLGKLIVLVGGVQEIERKGNAGQNEDGLAAVLFHESLKTPKSE